VQSTDTTVRDFATAETRETHIVKTTPQMRLPISTALCNPLKQRSLLPHKKQTDTPIKHASPSPFRGGANCKNGPQFAPPNFAPSLQPTQTEELTTP